MNEWMNDDDDEKKKSLLIFIEARRAPCDSAELNENLMWIQGGG